MEAQSASHIRQTYVQMLDWGTFHLEGGDDMATLGSLENMHTWQLLPWTMSQVKSAPFLALKRLPKR